MSFLNKITELLSNIGSKSVKSISRDEVINMLKCNMERLNLLLESYKTVKGFGKELEIRIDKAKKDKNMQYVSILFSFADHMQRTNDRTNPMKAMIDAALELHEVHQQLIRKMNTIVETRNINIYNAKISHSMLFGFIANTENFCSFGFSMLAGVIYDLTKKNGMSEISQLSKQEINNITDPKKFSSNISFVNAVNTKSTRSVIDSIDKFATDNDHLVDANGVINNRLNVSNLNDHRLNSIFGITVGGVIATVAAIPLIFTGIYAITHIAELIAWFRDYAYQRNKAEAEWIKNHIAVLELELAGMDPDSKEYRDKVKVIENYQKILAKYEADIAAYEAED